MSWLLGCLALGALVGTWALATNRWHLWMAPAKAQVKLRKVRRYQRQTRLAEAIVNQLEAGQ